MATFKNRALTIATLGVLSGVPITLATDGLIQLPEVVTPTVPTTPRAVVAGGARPGGRITLEYARAYEHRSALELQLLLQSETVFETQVPRDYLRASTLDLFMFGDAGITFSQLFEARSAVRAVVTSDPTASFTQPVAFNLEQDATLRSDVVVHYSRAGEFTHYSSMPSRLEGTATVTFTRAPEPVEVQPASSITHKGATTYALDGAASIRFLPAAVEDARAHLHTSASHLDLHGDAYIAFTQYDAAQYHHVTFADIALDGAAAFSFETNEFRSLRMQGLQHALLDGAAYAAITHAETPVEYSDEEAILLLFAQIITDMEDV